MRTNFFSNRLNSRYFMKYAGILLIFFIGLSQMTAQATLSVQGILKKSNGVALEDGEYAMTFKLYAVDGTPAGVLWDETIPNVELNGGIYSVVLGLVDPLTVPFDQDYELSVSVGASEMLPKIKLTSAPYALSLRGQSNQFPSTGLVLADKLQVAQGISADDGVPSNGNSLKTGYSFTDDPDTGLFSPVSGEASIYIDNVEKVEINSTGINLKDDGGITYTTVNSNGTVASYPSWRLVDVDNFINGPDDWSVYNNLSGQQNGWNSTIPSSISITQTSSFIGPVLWPNPNTGVLKKEFSIPGSWTEMKVKFRYYFVDSWDDNTTDNEDRSFAGFAENLGGTQFRVCWARTGGYLELNSDFSNNAFRIAENFLGAPCDGIATCATDFGQDVEMTARRRNVNDNSFYVFIGAALDGYGMADESYAVGPIEIWVR